uniref:BTB domain-containing protein n=1 Tax=Bionectria ochroleuca TaxID=29856 RepID=A0A8H7NMG8_BIOOC
MSRGFEARKERDYLSPPSAETFAAETLTLLFIKDIGLDAVITCRGEEFRIHKNIAAVRSAFMRVAFYGKFTEATDGRLSADEFEVEVVKQMVHYLYNGTYITPAQRNMAYKTRPVEEIVAQVEDYRSGSSQATRTGWQPQSQTEQPVTTAETLQFHIKMHNIADYYQIESLSKYSSICIQRLLAYKWDAGAFCEMLKLCWNEPVDDDIRELFAKTAAPHAVVLLDTPKFQTLDFKHAVAERVHRYRLRPRGEATRPEDEAAKLKRKAASLMKGEAAGLNDCPVS